MTETTEAERVWPDTEVRRNLEAIYLRSAADLIAASYPDHVWPRPTSSTARSFDPAALQAGFVEGVRFVCNALHGRANEASDHASQLAGEKAAS